MSITTELYYIQNALYSIGYSSSDVAAIVTLMYKCRTFGTYMENEISNSHSTILYDMYLCQRDEIDKLIPYLSATLYQYGPGPSETEALNYASYDLIYNSETLIYTTT